jgi:hypothetical protein
MAKWKKKKKTSLPRRKLNPSRPARSLVSTVTEFLDMCASCALTERYDMKVYWGSGGIATHVRDLGTRRKWVFSFRPRPLYSHENSPWFTMDRGLGGLQSRSGRGGEEKYSQLLPGIKPPIIQLVSAQRYTTELFRLLNWWYASLLNWAGQYGKWKLKEQDRLSKQLSAPTGSCRTPAASGNIYIYLYCKISIWLPITILRFCLIRSWYSGLC